jgi:hypothetical protein
MAHDRVVTGEIERQDPAIQPAVARGLAGALARVLGQAGQAGFVVHLQPPGLGGVEQVLLELRSERREFLHDLAEARTRLRRERHAGEAEVPQGILENLALCRAEPLAFFREDPLEGAKQALVLAKLAAVVGQQGQAGVVGLAQRLGILDRVQVPHRRPGARQFLLERLERDHQVVPAWRLGRGEDLLHPGATLVDDRAHRGFHVRGPDGREGRQAGEIE